MLITRSEPALALLCVVQSLVVFAIIVVCSRLQLVQLPTIHALSCNIVALHQVLTVTSCTHHAGGRQADSCSRFPDTHTHTWVYRNMSGMWHQAVTGAEQLMLNVSPGLS